jgi:CBS-domain-containing membrane protein
MKAADVMAHGVISVEPESSVLEAVRLMLEHRISGLPVVDMKGNLLGIVSEGDLLRRTETGTQRRRSRWLEFLMGPGKLASEYVHASGRKVHEVMTPGVKTVAEDTSLEQIVELMERHQIKRVPVMRGREVVGIVTRANLLRALAGLARQALPPDTDDAAIRERLLAELGKQPWAPIAQLNVLVGNGVVQLWGTIFDERQREAIRVAAENISGVKAIEDHLVWIEPTSGMVILPDEEGPQAKASWVRGSLPRRPSHFDSGFGDGGKRFGAQYCRLKEVVTENFEQSRREE